MDRELEAVTAKKTAQKAGVIQAERGPDDTDARAMARSVMRPSVGGAIAVQAVYGRFINGEHLEVGGLIDELTDQCVKVHSGDMRRMESVLVAQVHTLNALFTRLTTRAMAQDQLKQYETHLRLALKAQAQARATVEALAEMKNPRPVAFVRQANIAQNQQVNNEAGIAPPGAGTRTHESVERSSSAYARAKVGAGARGETEIGQNGLLEAKVHEGARSVARERFVDRVAVGGVGAGRESTLCDAGRNVLG